MKPVKLGILILICAGLAGLGLYAIGKGGRNQSNSVILNHGEMALFEFLNEPRPLSAGEFVDEAGNTVSLDNFRGRFVLLNFWASWCAPCLVELPSLHRLNEAMGGEDFTVIAVSTDRKGIAYAREFLEKRGIAAPPVFNDKTSKFAGVNQVKAMPTTILIDPEGREIGRLAAAAEWDSSDAKRLIDAVLQRVGTGASPE